ncbi:MAG: sensor histidine kinase [Herbinix sp.]|nr:sensor histidine kinase [Herbinix sp.]
MNKKRNSYKPIKNTSMRFRFIIAILFMSIVPGLILTFLFYNNMETFYKEKIQIYQLNLLNVMSSQLDNIINQSKVVSNQVLGLAVTSSSFDDYPNKDLYQKLKLMREVDAQLLNIRLANDSIDNIYLIGFDNNFYTSNSVWNKEEFLKLDWVKIDEKQGGSSTTIPTHKADYRYFNAGSYSPLVISQVTYLNTYNKNSIIGLVQIDISYKNIERAMSPMTMTDKDFAYIVDSKGNVIYCPDQSLVGLKVEGLSFKGNNLQSIGKDIGDNAYRKAGNQTIHASNISGTDWKIIQVNSETMLKEELTKARNIWFFVAIICLVSAILLALRLSLSITKPILQIVKSMKKVSNGNFDTKVEPIEDKDLAVLADSFNIMVSEIEKLMKENVQKENERITMELTALNAQINSHFLYNTLNTVKWMAIRSGVNDIAKMIVSLVNMLEYSCKNVDTPVLISDEIRFIGDYVYIQQVRCNNSANIKYELEDELQNCMILKMLLQPIVENAMLHGFADRSSGNLIRISGKLIEDHILFQIYDNGKGFPYDRMDKLTGVGLSNIQDRLRLNYGEKFSLILQSEVGIGTCVSVEIPVIKKVEDISAEDTNR